MLPRYEEVQAVFYGRVYFYFADSHTLNRMLSTTPPRFVERIRVIHLRCLDHEQRDLQCLSLLANCRNLCCLCLCGLDGAWQHVAAQPGFRLSSRSAQGWLNCVFDCLYAAVSGADVSRPGMRLQSERDFRNEQLARQSPAINCLRACSLDCNTACNHPTHSRQVSIRSAYRFWHIRMHMKECLRWRFGAEPTGESSREDGDRLNRFER